MKCPNLSKMIAMTEAKKRDSSKAHLHPAYYGSNFAYGSMTQDGSASNIPVDPAFPMEFEVYSEHDLSSKQQCNKGCKAGVNVVSKLASFVSMAQTPSHD